MIVAKRFVFLAAGAALGLAAVAAPAQLAAAPTGQAAIEARIELMKNEVLKPFGAIKKFLQEGEGTADDVVRHATALSEAATKITPLFPAGTGRGNFDDKTTRALSAIWRDWDKFEASANALRDEAARLAEVAAGGDKDAIAAQFQALGKNGCGSCHKPFRGPKAE